MYNSNTAITAICENSWFSTIILGDRIHFDMFINHNICDYFYCTHYILKYGYTVYYV